MREEIKQRIEQIRRGEVPEGYKRTKIGIVPEEWNVPKAKEVFESISDKKHDGTLEVLSATQDRGVVPRSQVDIDIKYDQSSVLGYKKVNKGDFVISLRSFQGGIEYSEYDGIVSPAYTVLKGKNKICRYFYKIFFKTDDYIKHLAVATYGIRDGKSISFEDFGMLRIPFPPLAEQEKIAEILQTQDKVIELQQKKIDELKWLKKVYLSKMFPKKGCNVPEIRFPGFTDPWEQRKLRELGTTYTGLTGKSKSDFGHGDGKFITYMNVFSNPITSPVAVEPIEIDDRQNEVQVGDAFFTTSSETPDEVGMSSVLLENKGKTYLNSFCFGYRPTVKMDSLYLAYMLRSDNVRKKIIFLAQGISRYNISKNKMMDIQVPLPSIEEQKQIGLYFQQLDHLITLHQRKLDEEQKKKKALMQLLLTGIARV